MKLLLASLLLSQTLSLTQTPTGEYDKLRLAVRAYFAACDDLEQKREGLYPEPVAEQNKILIKERILCGAKENELRDLVR